MLTFRPLTHDEFEAHRGTCPLEIGRFQAVGESVRELIGPLPIYKIWSTNDQKDRIHVSLSGETDFNRKGAFEEKKIVLGSDGRIYTAEDNIYYSITRVIEYP